MTWTTLSFAYGSTLTSTQMNQLYANFAALAAKDSGAPTLANSYITQAMIGASAVGQAQLKTTTGENSTVSSTHAIVTGGDYAFWPQIKETSSVSMTCQIANAYNGGSTYASIVYLLRSTDGTAYAQFRYIQASPPYDLGDGEIPLFIFAVVNNGTGEIESISTAPEAPWHLNGPTNTRADFYDKNRRGWRRDRVLNKSVVQDPTTGLLVPYYEPVMETVIDQTTQQPVQIEKTTIVEITQAIKQADMPLIPHPFCFGNDLTGKTVVMLDPVSGLTWQLAEHLNAGESVNELIHDGYIAVENVALNRNGPPGVMVVGHKWAKTRA